MIRIFCLIAWLSVSFIQLNAQTPSSTMDLQAITKLVTVNNFEFPYYDYGEGPVVLLLHGFPDSRYLWRNQLQPLADAGFRVIAPDLRGFGDAPKPQEVEAYAIPNILSDINGLLDTLEVEKLHVVGHDWGGTIAWLYAGNFPERCKSVTGLTVGAPGAPGRRDLAQLEKMWYIFFFQNEGTAEEWLRRDDWQNLRAWTRGKGDLEHNIKNLEQSGALTAGLNWYRSNFKPESLNSKSNPPRIKVPALGMAAENDAYLLEAHVKNSDAMIDASWEYHLIEDASHWLMLDQPEEFNRLLIDFLKRNEK